MKRTILPAAAAAVLVPIAVGVRADDAPPPLPLHDVVLFSSGVGYFQRTGRINGSTSVPLSFRVEQVNDILKSLVLFDPDGSVRPVTYATRDALSRQLNRTGQGLESTVTVGALLRRFQGARLRVELGAEAVEGRLISVSLKQLPVKDAQPVQVEVLNLLTDGGLKAIQVDQVSQVKLLDDRLDRELRESLALLATGLDDERRSVELKFSGNGAREVKAGYLQEMPVWKTSYRLVLDDQGKPYLQGWAHVENTTDEDWKDVHLSLVSGRPISFIQDLYQPLYIPRPVVQAQVIGSPTPQTYGESLQSDNGRVATNQTSDRMAEREFAKKPAALAAPAAPPPMAGRARGTLGGLQLEERQSLRKEAAFSVEQLAKSVASQAQGTERGDLFEYSIRQPVTLPRQQAAMVPIVTETVAGEKLSIYDPASDASHALNGFRLKNSTGLHLAGGPITVFQGGTYAGDAQITNLQPGEDRLLAYAVDLDLVAAQQNPKFRQDTLTVSAKSGVLTITRKQQQERTYTFRNKAQQPKVVLVEQPLEPEFKLVTPEKPKEKTADRYRFQVDVPAGKTAELKVVTERPVSEEIALFDADVNVLIAWAQNAQVSEKLRGSLKQLVQIRRKITDLQQQRSNRDAELKAIDQEQARIRQNMAQLDRNSALYQQYVKKLTDQETRIEKLRADIAQIREQEIAAQKELRAFVDGLTSE